MQVRYNHGDATTYATHNVHFEYKTSYWVRVNKGAKKHGGCTPHPCEASLCPFHACLMTLSHFSASQCLCASSIVALAGVRAKIYHYSIQ